MLDLLKIRDEIDQVDSQIVSLYEARMKLTSQVAAFKIETGKQVFDKERELSKLSKLSAQAHTDFNRHGVRELFEQIMSMSRKQQYQLLTSHGIESQTGFTVCADLFSLGRRFACVAESIEAAHLHYADTDHETTISCMDSLTACFDAVKEEAADFAFFPIQTEDADLMSGRYNKIAEYGFFILEEIEVGTDSLARYLLVTKKKVALTEADKLSICFEAPDECGSLYHLMSHFIYNGLNMNRIESMIIAKNPLDYRFFIDLSGNLNDSAIQNAFRGLQDEAVQFKILGNYR